MITKSSGNVFKDLGFNKTEAAWMLAKAKRKAKKAREGKAK